jgi:hypothetical protein
MADLADVENAIKALLVGIIYPNGASDPSIVSEQVTIGRGWPLAADIDTAMTAGNCIVSVYSQPGMERNTTRFPRSDEITARPNITLTATVSGKQITLGGTIATPQNIVVLCGTQFVFPYEVQSGDTLASAATNVAALIAAEFPGTGASGDVITIAGNPGIVQVRVAGQFGIWTEEARQERGIQITCWCATPALRDALAAPIDLALKQLPFFATPDQSAVRLRYARTMMTDEGEKVQIFRRDLFYTVEYPTVSVGTAAQTAAIGVSSALDGGPSSAPSYT